MGCKRKCKVTPYSLTVMSTAFHDESTELARPRANRLQNKKRSMVSQQIPSVHGQRKHKSKDTPDSRHPAPCLQGTKSEANLDLRATAAIMHGTTTSDQTHQRCAGLHRSPFLLRGPTDAQISIPTYRKTRQRVFHIENINTS